MLLHCREVVFTTLSEKSFITLLVKVITLSRLIAIFFISLSGSITLSVVYYFIDCRTLTLTQCWFNVGRPFVMLAQH